jgi:two-component system, NarL family, invasion response regulator UvrY
MIQMLVADRSETMRLGVCTLFNNESIDTMVQEATSRSDLIAKLQLDQYHLVLVDPLLAAGHEETFLRQIRTVAPRTNVLVYTELDEMHFGMRAIRCGVKGYVMKSRPADELLKAASRVGAGKVHLSDQLAEEVALNMWEGKDTVFHEALSDREYLVFAMLVCGRSVSRIAAALHLSVKTISSHKARAMRKLRCKSLGDLIQYSIANHLADECRVRCVDD